ncbi:uncharacterized protein LOC132738436 [Ruditapes philippinarum]|uniref:uncharacterized protein LOC132738436 n=1 Tax=Ruditapes philippinarum TaxID=129788 RepID=UPI00295ADF18|nr:uncharacterized protein LOC132738436 [Ruditapes philippinarum]
MEATTKLVTISAHVIWILKQRRHRTVIHWSKLVKGSLEEHLQAIMMIKLNTIAMINHEHFLIRNSEVNVSVRQSIESSSAESHSNLSTINRDQSNSNFRNELTEVNVSSAVETGSQIQTNQNSEHSSFASNAIQEEGTRGVSSSMPPKYPNYVSKTARLSSYSDCGTSSSHQTAWHRPASSTPVLEIVSGVTNVESQTGNESISTQGTEGIGRGSGNASADIDRLMHTNAAQSVLEMGYHPDVIRRAIRMVLSSTGHGILTATNIMEKIFEIEDSESQENTEPENAEIRAPANTEARASTNVEARARANTDERAPTNVEARAPPNTEARAPVNTEARTPANAESRQSNNETFTTTTQEIQGLENRHESATPQNAALENVSGAVARGNEKLLDNGSSENQPKTATRHNDDDKKCSGNVNGDERQGRQQNVSTMSSGGSKRANSKQTTRESPASRYAHIREQKRLKEENDMLKQQSLCTKCHVNDVCIVFLPCVHLVTCETCAPTVRYCTVVTCGKYIKGTVRTYLA